MAAIPRREQSEDSDLRPLISHEHDTPQYGTITGSTGSATELRFIMLGGDEALMADACDIILRERAGRTEIQHRKGHVFGKKVIVVKTPSTWMSRVASCLCFSSRVKSIKDEMVDCASLVFPGPHAFLLVTDNSKVIKEEKYLLKAIAEVFGKEALDYVMLLIIGRTEPKGIDSVRKYVRKFYTLEDTEQSVQSLFAETEIMTQNNESTFFIQPSYKNLMKAFLSWEKERDAEIQKQHAQEMTALKERFRLTESNLKKETDTLRQLMLAAMIRLKKYKDSEEQNQQGASGGQEDLLFKECSDTTLKNMFPSIIDDFTERENALKEQLAACKDTVSTLKDMYSSLTDDYVNHQIKSENEKLQRELEELKLKEREWEQKLKEEEDRLRQEKDLSRREKELESKERGTAKKEQYILLSGEEHMLHLTSPARTPLSHQLLHMTPAPIHCRRSNVSEEKQRSLDERKGEWKSKDEDSHDSESLEFGKPVRRNSSQFDIPNKQNENSDLHRPLLSDDDTFTTEPESTGLLWLSTKELRFIMLGGDEDLMDHACDIILRKRAARADFKIRHRKGHVFGRKVIVVKTPPTWMSQVASCLCFSSGVKSIKDEMVDCASLVFPGPHAFLLVTDNRKVTEKEKYLLKAIAEVFGKEALDYVMLLIIGRTEPKGIDSVRNYVRKFYTLEDTEQSVQCLFRETEIMIQNNESTFFIQPSYKNLMKKAFLSWEKERDAEIQKHYAQEMTALKERFRLTESNLKTETDTLRQLMLAAMIRLNKYKDSEEQNQQGASGAQEDLLFKECSDTALKNMFPSIIDDFTERENALKEQLAAYKETVSTLKDMYSSLTDDYVHHDSQMKSENEKLQRELEQHKLKERELEQKLKEVEDRLRQEEDLSRREKELESKEGGTTKKEQEIQTTGEEHNLHSNVELTSPGLSQEQRRPLDEREGELSKDEDSHDSESLEFGKHERRNSNQFAPPNMPGSEHGPLDTL